MGSGSISGKFGMIKGMDSSESSEEEIE